jgi:hypothetical protein
VGALFIFSSSIHIALIRSLFGLGLSPVFVSYIPLPKSPRCLRNISVFCHHEDALECLPRLSAALHIAAVHEVTASKKAPHAQSSSRLGLQSTSPAASFQQSFYKGVSLYSIMSPIGSHRRILFTGNLLDTVQFLRHSAQSLRRA